MTTTDNGYYNLLDKLVNQDKDLCQYCGGSGIDDDRSFIDGAGFAHVYQCEECRYYD